MEIAANEDNDVNAMELLAKCYENGFGVVKSKYKAQAWREKAATISVA